MPENAEFLVAILAMGASLVAIFAYFQNQGRQRREEWQTALEKAVADLKENFTSETSPRADSLGGRLSTVESKVDNVEFTVNGRIAAGKGDLDLRITSVESTLKNIDATVESRITPVKSDLERGIRDLQSDIANIKDVRIPSTETKFNESIASAESKLDRRVGVLESDVANVKDVRIASLETKVNESVAGVKAQMDDKFHDAEGKREILEKQLDQRREAFDQRLEHRFETREARRDGEIQLLDKRIGSVENQVGQQCSSTSKDHEELLALKIRFDAHDHGEGDPPTDMVTRTKRVNHSHNSQPSG